MFHHCLYDEETEEHKKTLCSAELSTKDSFITSGTVAVKSNKICKAKHTLA